ncbi:AIM24 family protein (plasmid) [Halarchaeum sp. CBA1220]|uniref:AIM24 family protein n=1 Tax=Halarchaeum sp. CBA1220 TaxID=1853682 RepID=UPI000F3A93C5|nr:AIM24 family protein [Halarchaeum sp. CBA1220]QLC35144.1 AIM24 family protein [Halarchaeum sp. CBA1220]
MDVDEFVEANEPGESGERFELENGKLLDVDVDGAVIAKAGSMVAFDGDLTFSGKSSAEGGVVGFLKEKASSEGTPVMEVSGQGHLYLADQGKEVQLLELDDGEAISVNGPDVLAFEDSVSYEISVIGSLGGASAAGLTNVFLTGPGTVAVTTHGDPLVLTPPVRTDPEATVAWSRNLSPSVESNRSLSDFIGSDSDERYQLVFEGEEGFVVVQPYEEGPVEPT